MRQRRRIQLVEKRIRPRSSPRPPTHRSARFRCTAPEKPDVPQVLGAPGVLPIPAGRSGPLDLFGRSRGRAVVGEATATTRGGRLPERRGAPQVAQMQQKFVDLKPALLPLFERFEPLVLSGRVKGYLGHPNQMTRLENVTKAEAE